MDPPALAWINDARQESADLDFKSSFDPSAGSEWCELIKDFVAMANSGGGVIVIGVNDDGTPAAADLKPILALDPAKVSDKLQKYIGQHFSGFTVTSACRDGQAVAVLAIQPSPVPLVFTAPGTYDVGGGKQKSAFAQGSVYFRHGAKSEPGTTNDLRMVIEREVDRIRRTWLDGIKKVVTAPSGAKISVLPADVKLSATETANAVRLVNDENAPAFKAVRTDLLYPHRQKEVVATVNKLLPEAKITAHDVLCVRKTHHIEGQPNYFYKPQYSSPQYSDTFVEWLVAQFRADPEFFQKAREACRKAEQS